MIDRMNFGYVFIRTKPEEGKTFSVTFGEATRLLMDFDVLIEYQPLQVENRDVYVKIEGQLKEIGDSLPDDLMQDIILSEGAVRCKKFSYWYNQFDPDMEDFDEIEYLFEKIKRKDKDKS